jgi:hypothetical protein
MNVILSKRKTQGKNQGAIRLTTLSLILTKLNIYDYGKNLCYPELFGNNSF